MEKDYIVNEVRKHRREIEIEGEHDFKKIIARAIANQEARIQRKNLKHKNKVLRTRTMPLKTA